MTYRRRRPDRLFCDQVLATYSRLRSIRGTARQLNCTVYAVNQVLSYCGVKPVGGGGSTQKRAGRRQEAQYAYLRQLRDAGIPVKEIAQQNGVSVWTVYRATKRPTSGGELQRGNLVDQVHSAVFHRKSLADLAERNGLTYEQLMHKYLRDFETCRAKNTKR